MKKNKYKETIDEEYYFIQFLFCTGRDLLRQENRDLYDVMLNKYIEIYLEGKESRQELKDINDKFLAIFGA